MKEAFKHRRNRLFVRLMLSQLTCLLALFLLLTLIVPGAGLLRFIEKRQDGLSQARLLTYIIEVEILMLAPVDLLSGDGIKVDRTREAIGLRAGLATVVIDLFGRLIFSLVGIGTELLPQLMIRDFDAYDTILTDSLNLLRVYIWGQPDMDASSPELMLSIARKIVEAHSGLLWAENIKDLGSPARANLLGARFVVGLSV